MEYMTDEQCSLPKSVAYDTFAKAPAYYVGPSVVLQPGDEALAPASWAGSIPQKDFAVETALSSQDGLKTLPGIAAKDPDLMLCLRNASLFPLELQAGEILATSHEIPEGTTLQRRAEHPVSGQPGEAVCCVAGELVVAPASLAEMLAGHSFEPETTGNHESFNLLAARRVMEEHEAVGE